MYTNIITWHLCTTYNLLVFTTHKLFFSSYLLTLEPIVDVYYKRYNFFGGGGRGADRSTALPYVNSQYHYALHTSMSCNPTPVILYPGTTYSHFKF